MGKGLLLDGYIVQLRAEYSRASRAYRAELLDRFVTVTGFHRKSAIRALNRPHTPLREVRQRSSRYEPQTVDALRVIWGGLGRPCSKRLQPALVEMAEVFARHHEITLSEAMRQQLRTMSPATIDRLLRPYREADGAGDRRWRELHRTAMEALAAANRQLSVRDAPPAPELEALCQKLRVRTNLYAILFQAPMSSKRRGRRADEPAQRAHPLECLFQSGRVSAHQLATFQETYERINPAKLLREIERLVAEIRETVAGRREGGAGRVPPALPPVHQERIAG